MGPQKLKFVRQQGINVSTRKLIKIPNKKGSKFNSSFFFYKNQMEWEFEPQTYCKGGFN